MDHQYFLLKQIFLWELISNSSDTLERLDMEAWQTPAPRLLGRSRTFVSFPTNVFKPSLQWILELEWPRPIWLITSALLPSLKPKPSWKLCRLVQTSLIGLLGDGFYSLYLFAEKMTVVTKQRMSSLPRTPQQGTIHSEDQLTRFCWSWN